MSRDAPIKLPPTRLDLAAERAIYRKATPPAERALQVVTKLADEKVVGATAALFWAYARLNARDVALKQEADRLLLSVALATALQHLAKLLVARRRPNRTLVHKRRRGVPLSGNAWDSFPSGHSLQLGAAAPAAIRLAPSGVRPFVWPTAIGLAVSRAGLVAHYPTDVAAGLAIGLALDQAAGIACQAVRSITTRRQRDRPPNARRKRKRAASRRRRI